MATEQDAIEWGKAQRGSPFYLTLGGQAYRGEFAVSCRLDENGAPQATYCEWLPPEEGERMSRSDAEDWAESFFRTTGGQLALLDAYRALERRADEWEGEYAAEAAEHAEYERQARSYAPSAGNF